MTRITPRRQQPSARQDLVYLGIKGAVVALDGATGQEVWRTELKGSYFTNVAREGDRLLAATRGEIFCLDANTGALRWHNPLKGMGFGLITIGTAAQAPAAAQQMADEESAHSAQVAAMHAPPASS